MQASFSRVNDQNPRVQPAISAVEARSAAVQKVERASPVLLEQDTASLIQSKLKHTSRQLKPEESIALLVEYTRQGRIAAEGAKGKELIAFIGNTESGKSTLANYLLGRKMARKNPKEFGLAGPEVVVVADANQEVMKIGHGKDSMTFLPQFAEGEAGSCFCDCPGFFDNRGYEINVANAVNIKAVFLAATSLKIVILINYNSLRADRARGLNDLLRICEQLFGNKETFYCLQNSILIGFTRIPVRTQETVSLSELQKFFANTSESENPFSKSALQSLSHRLFIYDPLDELGAES